LAKASDQFRQKDVTFWGLAALGCAAFAVLTGNVSGFVPEGLVTALHSPRQTGASLSQLRAQVSALGEEQARMRRDGGEIANRLSLGEKASGQITQRVGALEVSVPDLLEAMPPATQVDRSAVTASIPDNDAATEIVRGGSVRSTVRPLPGTPAAQPLPALVLPETPEDRQPPEAASQSVAVAPAEAPSVPALAPAPPTPPDAVVAPAPAAARPRPAPAVEAEAPAETPVVFAVAIGSAVTPDGAGKSWDDLAKKLGPLVGGMTPLLVPTNGGVEGTIVAGPLSDLSQASELCRRAERVNISCLPVPYTGEPLSR